MSCILPLVLFGSLARAAEESDSPAEPAPGAPAEPAPGTPAEPAPAAPLPPPDLSTAVRAPTIDKKELRRPKPSPFHLPAHPRAQVDFTAYTLEFGEVKLGVSNITVGIIPHVQAGTSVLLDVLGIPNVQAKVHVTEKGPWDLAGWVEYDRLVRSDFDATLLTGGGIFSYQAAPPLGLHLGASYTSGEISGDISLDTIDQLLWFLDSGAEAVPDHGGSQLKVQTVNARLAADIRFNRRDAIVFQASGTIHSKLDRDEALFVPSFLGLEDAMELDGFVNPFEAGMASVAWQFTWENWEARVGAGLSSIPGAWILNTWELSYRFGGPTRGREGRMLETWEKNADDLDAAAPPPAPLPAPPVPKP